MRANEKENAKRKFHPLPFPYVVGCFGRNFKHESLSINVLTSDNCVVFPSAHHLKWAAAGRRPAMRDGSLDGRANGAYQHLMQTLWQNQMSGVFKKSHWQHFAVPNICAFVMSVLSLASQ